MKFLLSIGASALAALVASQALADTTIRFGHLWPTVAGPHTQIMQVWADTVEAESNGRIKVEIYPSGQLSAPPAQYDSVKNRVMDATATVIGYSAGRFPLTQVVELPGVSNDGKHGSCILQTMFDQGLLDTEYEDTHPLFFFVHGAGAFHTKGTLVDSPDDLEGLRIRRPTVVVANILTELGAQPVGMPAPESYTAMQRGVIDGVALPWEGVLSFRLNEEAEYHTEIGGMYTAAFIVTMNKDLYESLSAEDKAVIDANSGMKWASIAGRVFDDMDVVGRQQAVDAGHTITVIEGGVENAAWKGPIENARTTYLNDVAERNLPAMEVYQQALSIGEQCR